MGGADKLLQIVDGMPLLRRTALRAMAAGPVIAALPPSPHPRYDALVGLEVNKVAVPDAAEGMNASLRGALACVRDDATAVMILLADLPDLTEEDLIAMQQSVTDNPDHLIWRGATSDGKPGHPVVFDKSLFSQLSQLTGDSGAQSIVKAQKDKVHIQPLPNRNALLDLDTPEDWAAWRAAHPK